jgi:membrane protein YqaA with SNARE-associated domain
MQINRERMWQPALAALVGCIAGALCGYAAGHFLHASVGAWIVSLADNG